MKQAKSLMIAALLLFALPAWAGDTARVEILGFSADGGLFAFEEYGVQDGSGFAYANRYYIDTASDRFVSGSPVRVRLDSEGASVETARAEARAQGQAIIEDSVLADHMGETAGWNAVTELSADPFRLAVNPRPVEPPIDDVLEFRLQEIPMPGPGRCEGLDTPIVGFRLLRIAATADARTRLVQEDERVPSSRGCPTGYRLGGIQTYHPSGAPPVFAVFIAIRGYGFEGPDYRWIAVTGRL